MRKGLIRERCTGDRPRFITPAEQLEQLGRCHDIEIRHTAQLDGREVSAGVERVAEDRYDLPLPRRASGRHDYSEGTVDFSPDQREQVARLGRGRSISVVQAPLSRPTRVRKPAVVPAQAVAFARVVPIVT